MALFPCVQCQKFFKTLLLFPFLEIANKVKQDRTKRNVYKAAFSIMHKNNSGKVEANARPFPSVGTTTYLRHTQDASQVPRQSQPSWGIAGP